MKLTDRHIVLTGATSGIGREIATMLAPTNRLTLIGRRYPPTLEVSAAGPHRFIATDLADPEAVRIAAAMLAAEGVPVDGLINCAAVQFTPRLLDPDFDPAGVSREVAINFVGPVLLIAGLLEAMGRADAPFILNVNSGLGLVPKARSGVYCASKAALDSFSQSLRGQLADTPIRVMQAFLPMVDTPMTDGRGGDKMSAASAARAIVRGIEREVADNDIGKVSLLRLLRRLSPGLAARVMQGHGQ